MATSYNLVRFEKAGDAYQEIVDGAVVRYVAVDGVELFKVAPLGDGSVVLAADVNAEALGLAAARASIEAIELGAVEADLSKPAITQADVDVYRRGLEEVRELARNLVAHCDAILGG